MTRCLDVMVIGSDREATIGAAGTLEAAGHRPHLCSVGPDPFPCDGLTDPGRCPLNRHMDVALLAHSGTAEPLGSVPGVTCALRARVPLVEHGPTGPDEPYAPWLAAPAGDDVVATCEAAGEAALDGLRQEILRFVAPVLREAGIAVHPGLCRLDPGRGELHVGFVLPGAVPVATKQALAVRALDALRGAGHTYGPAQVSVNDSA